MKQTPDREQPMKVFKTSFSEGFLSGVFEGQPGPSLVSFQDRKRDLKRKSKAQWYECEDYPAVGTALILSVDGATTSVLGQCERQHVLTRRFYGSHARISQPANVTDTLSLEAEHERVVPEKPQKVVPERASKKKWKTHSTVVVELMKPV